MTNQNTYNQSPMGQGNHMKILEVSRYKNNFADHQLPFVTEQGEALRAAGCEVDYFLVKGNYITAVKAYDIQKLSGSHVRMQVQVADGWDKAQEAKLTKEMKRLIGAGCEFTLEYVEGVEVLKNGKRKYFMNDLAR